jgi:hypothetical protein
MAFAGVSVAMCLCTSAALAAVDPALLKARQKFFGIENVDVNTGAVKKDKVITSWLTNTTYLVSIMGNVILLDSYISRPELPTTPIDRRYAPFLPQDLVDAKPVAIFLGHGHGDHAHNGAYIAKWTGATIYASPETCFSMQADVTRMFNDPNLINGGAKIVPDGDPVNCVGVVPAGSRPGQWNEGPNAGLFKSSATKLSTPLDFSGLRSRVQAHPFRNSACGCVLSACNAERPRRSALLGSDNHHAHAGGHVSGDVPHPDVVYSRCDSRAGTDQHEHRRRHAPRRQ